VRRRWLHAIYPLLLFLVVAPLLPARAGAEILVRVTGVAGDARENVLRALSLHRDRAEPLSERRIRALHAQAPDEIRQALEPFGFYRAAVDADLARDGDIWRANYVVSPGPPLPVARVDVQVSGEGRTDREFRRLVRAFPLAPGDALDQRRYESAKQLFQKTAAERGYFDMRFTEHELRIDLDAYRADVVLHMDTGARYRFGDVSFEQDREVLAPAVLARYTQIQPGDPYSNTALIELQRALLDSDYYGEAEVTADPKQAEDNEIPVAVRLTARKPSRYTFGLGYGTDTGVRGQLGWERRYLNPAGHSIRAETRLSEIEKSLSASYIVPIRDPRTDQVAFTATYSEGDTLTYFTELRRLGMSRAVARGGWREILSLNLQREDFVIGDESGSSTLLMPDAQWSRTWARDRIYTRDGVRLVLGLRGAADSLGSDTDFVQARTTGKWIEDIGRNGRIIARADIGATRVDDFRELPPSIRFFAGGDRSVRGYDFNTLGPTDASGDVVGGRHLLVTSLEYEHVVYGNWSAAVFYDAGNALDDFNDPLKEGAGFGIRWKSPIGQVRVDVATALSDPDRPWRLHLNVGPDL